MNLEGHHCRSAIHQEPASAVYTTGKTLAICEMETGMTIINIIACTPHAIADSTNNYVHRKRSCMTLVYYSTILPEV